MYVKMGISTFNQTTINEFRLFYLSTCNTLPCVLKELIAKTHLPAIGTAFPLVTTNLITRTIILSIKNKCEVARFIFNSVTRSLTTCTKEVSSYQCTVVPKNQMPDSKSSNKMQKSSWSSGV